MKIFNSTLVMVLLINLLYAQSPFIKQWDNRFGGYNTEYFSCLQQTEDGGFILGGTSYSTTGGDKTDTLRGITDFWIVKTDSVGNKLWDKTFGGSSNDDLYNLIQTSDGGYLLGGLSRSGISGDKTQNNWDISLVTADYWIVKIDTAGNKQWDKRFGGTDEDNLFSLKETFDGNFLLAGASRSGVGGDKSQSNWGIAYDYWVIKIDNLGNKIWDKRFGGTDDDELATIIETADHGFLIGGSSLSGQGGDKTQPSWGSFDYWIVKIDSNGTIQWDKRFGGSNPENLKCMLESSTGEYLIGGYSLSSIGGDKSQNSQGASDYWILKLNLSGNKLWDKTFGGTDMEDEIGNILQTQDSDFLISGNSYSPLSGDKSENNMGIEQGWLVKYDSSGIMHWDKTIFTTGHDENSMTVQSLDGCYVIACYTNADTGGYKSQFNWNFSDDFWIVKLCDTSITFSINQISNPDLLISIYPNPVKAKLNVILNKMEYITITNIMGEVVLNTKGNGKVEIDVSFLPDGIYFIKAGNESDSYRIRKFVKE